MVKGKHEHLWDKTLLTTRPTFSVLPDSAQISMYPVIWPEHLIKNGTPYPTLHTAFPPLPCLFLFIPFTTTCLIMLSLFIDICANFQNVCTSGAGTWVHSWTSWHAVGAQ